MFAASRVNPHDVRQRDDLLLRLRALVRSRPDDARAAGARLQCRAIARLRAHQEERRETIERELELMELAKQLVLMRKKSLRKAESAGGAPWDARQLEHERRHVASYARQYRRYQRERSDLATVSAFDAHVEVHALWCQEHEQRKGLPISPAQKLRSAREEEFQVPANDSGLGLHVGLVVQDIIDAPFENLRDSAEWWEFIVAALFEDMVTPLADLGVSVDLIEGEWRKPGPLGDMFDHREGLREYAFADPEGQEDERLRSERLWLLAERAATRLAEPPSNGGTDGVGHGGGTTSCSGPELEDRGDKSTETGRIAQVQGTPALKLEGIHSRVRQRPRLRIEEGWVYLADSAALLGIPRSTAHDYARQLKEGDRREDANGLKIVREAAFRQLLRDHGRSM